MTAWYTITIVQHAEHPELGEVASKPVELIACTVLPTMAGTILRGVADEIAPPVLKRAAKREASDDVLREVAEVYRREINNNPTKAIAEHLGVADRTARLYVRRARDAGYLGEALRGKAGEA